MNILKILEEFEPDRYSLKTVIPSDQIGEAAMRKRREIGKGFTRERTMRHIAEIPLDELVALGHSGCDDAVAAAMGDDAALKKLIKLHPEWRVSEGQI